jgi:hypothetical protein
VARAQLRVRSPALCRNCNRRRSEVRMPASTNSFTPSRGKEGEHDSRPLISRTSIRLCELYLPDPYDDGRVFCFSVSEASLNAQEFS